MAGIFITFILVFIIIICINIIRVLVFLNVVVKIKKSKQWLSAYANSKYEQEYIKCKKKVYPKFM